MENGSYMTRTDLQNMTPIQLYYFLLIEV